MNWKRMILLVIGLQGGVGALAYSASLTGPIIFMTTIMKPPISLALASELTIVSALVALPFYPLIGWLSDKIESRKKVVYSGVVANAVLLYPSYYLIGMGGSIGNVFLMAAGMILMTVLYVVVSAPVIAFFNELFPTRVRYTSFAFTYSLSIALFGGFTPFIVSAIANAAGEQFFIGLLWPIIFPIISAIVGILYVKETHCKLSTVA